MLGTERGPRRVQSPARAESCWGWALQALVSLAKPLLIPRSSDTWLVRAPLRPHPSAETRSDGGAGGRCPPLPPPRAMGLGLVLCPCHPPSPAPRAPPRLCLFPSPAAAPWGSCVPWHGPAWDHLPGVWHRVPPGGLQGCSLPSALGSCSSPAPALALSSARGCGPLAHILMLEGPPGRSRGSWLGREGGIKGENTFAGLV